MRANDSHPTNYLHILRRGQVVKQLPLILLLLASPAWAMDPAPPTPVPGTVMMRHSDMCNILDHLSRLLAWASSAKFLRRQLGTAPPWQMDYVDVDWLREARKAIHKGAVP